MYVSINSNHQPRTAAVFLLLVASELDPVAGKALGRVLCGVGFEG